MHVKVLTDFCLFVWNKHRRRRPVVINVVNLAKLGACKRHITNISFLLTDGDKPVE